MTDTPASPRPSLGAVPAGALSLFLYASLLVVPFVGLIVAPLGLIPVVQYHAGGGPAIRAWGPPVLVLAALALVVGGWGPLLALLGYLLLIVLPVTSLEWWVARAWSDGRWVAVTTAIALAVILLAVVVAAWPAPPQEAMAGWAHQWAQRGEEIYVGAGVPRGRVQLALDVWERSMGRVLPIVPLAYLVLVLFWLRARLGVLHFALPPHPFERYRSEEWLSAAFALAGLGTLALGGAAGWVAVNVLAGVLVLYFAHGLAIIRAHLARLIGRGWLVRWGVGLVCLSVPYVVAALGLVDSFVNLRPSPSQSDGRQ